MLTTLSIAAVLALLIAAAIRCFGGFGARASQPERPPIYELVKRIESVDAVRALEILRGDHGLFRFEEMKWHEAEADDPYEADGYWAPTMCSGLYETADATERDARAEIPWLRGMMDA